jgi:carbamoyltransferase
MTVILGINSAYHESAACLIVNGQIVAAIEEERLSRVKHAKPARVDNPHELPVQAIDWCLRRAGLAWRDVDHVGYSFKPEARLRNKTFNDAWIEGDWGSPSGEDRFYQKVQQVPQQLALLAGDSASYRFHWIDHHLAHAASAYFVSPYDEAAILVVDGIAEFASTALYAGSGKHIALLDTISYPHSLGFLWEKLSKFLGFSEYDAYKVMGLAAYGRPEPLLPAFGQLIRSDPERGYFEIDPEVLKFRVEDYTALERVLGPRRTPQIEIGERHANIAAALQKVTEDVLLDLTHALHRMYPSANLCIAGGVALNCLANRVLQERGPFAQVYIQPAAHDGGTAIGAAYAIWHQLLEQPRAYVMRDPYLGPDYSRAEVQQALDAAAVGYSYHEDIERVAARLLADGQKLGWFQGRLEIGPRALGNRSLLADPRDAAMKQRLNSDVKHRETFRPFAPSVLAERAAEWFDLPKPSPATDFMLFAYYVHDDKRALIPAVTHADGTSRIQTVQIQTNPRYHRLISEFAALTDVPLLLNTSFNDNEPIVCSPADAINTFLKTGIDALAIDNFLVCKGSGHD